MAVSAASVSVATTATQLNSADAGGVHDPRGQSVLVKVPTGGVTVYVGGSAVTTGTGYPVEAGEALAFDLAGGEALYGIVASGTQAVNVLNTGV